MAGRFSHELPFGAQLMGDGTVRFRLWAPSENAVSVILETPRAAMPLRMTAKDGGWFELITDQTRAGSRYKYELSDGFRVPDPASRFQPGDVHGPSQVVDPKAYLWRSDRWLGLPWEQTILYEAHLGCFNGKGDFDGARRRLDHLAGLGITAIELMPIADFEGRRNWGYDGALLFAPDSTYGTPDQLKRLIDEAHDRRLMVFLDIVYNHFGPSGNYLGRYASDFFTDRHRTPWGSAINFDGGECRPVRDFFVHNALYWLEEFRFDGLRFDAVHAIRDDSRPDILQEIAGEVHRHIDPRRHVHLVLENDDNAARYLERVDARRPRYYTAQWNDDFHHAGHVIATGEKWGYYADYAESTVAAFGRSLAEGFIYQGEESRFRRRAKRGEPSDHLPPTAFVAFNQNHDQIGNRAFGERLASLAMKAPYRALTAILLLSPQIPMLFMGEEWGTRVPFLFFCDFSGELATAVREGRHREFSRLPAFRDKATQWRIPDPNAIETFERSRLDWDELEHAGHKQHLIFVRGLLELRHAAIIPRLASLSNGRGSYEVVEGRALRVRWRLGPGESLSLVTNLSPHSVRVQSWKLPGERIYACPEEFPSTENLTELPAWSVCFTLESELSES